MRPFFSTPQRIECLQRSGGGWVGTPFHPNAMFKGRGASCQMLVAAQLIECGHLDIDDRIPEGPMQWHGSLSLIEKSLDGHFKDRFQSIFGAPSGEGTSHPPHPPDGDPLSLIQPGDIPGFAVDGVIHHCGIFMSSTDFLHVMRHSRATIVPIMDATWLSRFRRLWRPIE